MISVQHLSVEKSCFVAVRDWPGTALAASVAALWQTSVPDLNMDETETREMFLRLHGRLDQNPW